MKLANQPSPRRWPNDHRVLRIANRSNGCSVLGPWLRAVIWVQGCRFRCQGCVAPETLPFVGGNVVQVDDLADELIGLPDIEGVTISGGEPFDQPGALCRLIDCIRARRDLGMMSYTGFVREDLERRGSRDQRALLARLDLLVDGPYLPARHTDLVWRGSDNQRIHLLSSRYERLRPIFDQRGSAIEIEEAADGSVHWMGIPPQGFREAFENEMRSQGIILQQ